MLDLMNLALTALVAVLAIIFGALVSDQVKASAPALAGRLVKVAVSWMAAQKRERFEEEWLACIDETQGALAKLICAVGFVCVSVRESEMRNSRALSGALFAWVLAGGKVRIAFAAMISHMLCFWILLNCFWAGFISAWWTQTLVYATLVMIGGSAIWFARKPPARDTKGPKR
jgi:hypothetical protein